MTTTYLTGNTYAVRDEIKAIPGARWDPARKAWVIEPGTMRERAIQSQAIYALRAKGVRATS
jgi:hypothetical protein